MAIAAGTCPSCGAPVEFKAGTSMSLVCPQCRHVVVRTDRDLKNLGKVADVVFNDSSLAHGDSGVFREKTFTVQGRVVMQHPQGGTWEEYYVLFDGKASWIEEAMGRWYVVEQVTAEPPAFETLSLGGSVDLGAYGAFVVDELSEGTFLSAEGELPFSAAPGTLRRFADLTAADGARASIHYLEGAPAPEVFIGIETTFAELGVFRRSGERAEHHVDAKEIKCPNCGAPLPARKDPKAERFACNYCGAIASVATNEVVMRQDISRLSPTIPLGTTGMLDATPWTVIGYMKRTTTIEGEEFSWEEFLLYNSDVGYRWLISDEGVWRLCAALNGGDVGTEDFPSSVQYEHQRYGLRNSGPATVQYVLGEFYWQVAIGESVLSHDFEHGRQVISREASGTEINWTLADTIPTNVIATAFGVKVEDFAYIPMGSEHPLLESSLFGGGGESIGKLVAVVVFFLFFVVLASASECGGGGDDAYNRGAGGSGGFGGMGGK
jgi:hypothetical protein